MRTSAAFWALGIVTTLLLQGCDEDPRVAYVGNPQTGEAPVQAGDRFGQPGGGGGSAGIPGGGAVPPGPSVGDLTAQLFGDSDKDGVAATRDRCPNTPTDQVALVDANTGCAPSETPSGPSTPRGGDGAEGARGRPESFTVDMSKADRWVDYCLAVLNKDRADNQKVARGHITSLLNDPNNDTDKDKIPDQCEEALSNPAAGEYQLPGLDNDTPNGAIVAGKKFVKDKGPRPVNDKALSSLQLTEEEERAYKDDRQGRGRIESGLAKYERQIAKKFSALKALNNSDLVALSKLFSIEQAEVKKEEGKPFSRERAGSSWLRPDTGSLAQNILKDQTLTALGLESHANDFAFVKGGSNEAIPYSLANLTTSKSAAVLSGIGSDTDTLREDDQLAYFAEFFVQVPAAGMRIRVGHLSIRFEDGKAMAASGTSDDGGLFIVLVNSETKIIDTDLITDHGDTFAGRSGGNVASLTGCNFAHVVIGYLAGKRDKKASDAVVVENVFFSSDDTADQWWPIPQDMMRVTPPASCEMTTENYFFRNTLGDAD